MRRFECSEDGHAKFWAGGVEGTSLTTQWGKLGTSGQSKTKDFAAAAAADAELAKLIKEKLAKGYVEVGAPAAAPPARPAKAKATKAARAAEPAAGAGDDPFPALDRKAAAKVFARKLNTRTDRQKFDKDVEDLAKVTGGRVDELMWHLSRTGVVRLAENPRAWLWLSGAHATGEEVLRFVSAIDAETAREQKRDIPDWPRVIDALVVRSFVKDPAAWKNARASLPEVFHDGYTTVLARFGELQPHDVPKGILDRLAAFWLEESDVSLLVRGDDGAPHEVRASETSEPRLQSVLDPIIDRLGTRGEWAKAVAKAARRDDLITSGYHLYTRSILREAAPLLDQTLALAIFEALHGTTTGDTGAYAWLASRSDSVESLTALAARLEEEHPSAAELSMALAVHRLTAKGAPIPAAFDRQFSLTPRACDMQPVVRALAALPEKRVAAIVARLDAESREFAGQLILAVAAHPTPALIAELAPAFARRTSRWSEWDSDLSEAMAFLPRDVLEALRAPFVDEGSAARDYFAAADVFRLRNDAIANRAWGEEEDARITFPWLASVAPAMRRVLQALPRGRADAILLRELDPKNPSFARVYAHLEHASDAVLERAFALLAANVPKMLRGPDLQDAVSRGLEDIKERALPFAARALASGSSNRALSSFLTGVFGEEELAQAAGQSVTAETFAERIARLAREVPGKAVGIYVFDVAANEKPAANEVGRVDGPPIGVTAKTWAEHDGTPMTHVCTLDLSLMPEVAAHFPGKRAIALFVPDLESLPDGLVDDTRILLQPFTEAELARGAAKARVPGDAEDGELDPKRLSVTAVRVPVAIFDKGKRSPRVAEIRDLVFNAPGYALGEPMWTQRPERDDGEFLLQISPALGGVAARLMGDGAQIYVFADGVCWQPG